MRTQKDQGYMRSDSTALVTRLFSDRPLDEAALRDYRDLRNALRDVSLLVLRTCPDSAERTLAVRALHLASFHAFTALAINCDVITAREP